MKKFFASLIIASLAAGFAVAADTTYSTRNQKKIKKVKPPVNLYVPAASQSNPTSMQGLYGQQFVPQVNIQPGGNSGVQITTPYFERQDVFEPEAALIEENRANPYQDSNSAQY